MKIDISNYEIWLTDFLDGNLDEEQAAELMHFLESNPELKEEAENAAALRITDSSITFPKKGLLKKSLKEMHPAQFELLCIMHLENDISPEQEEELQKIIGNDLHKRMLFQQIMKLKLAPSKIEYSGRQSLKRRNSILNPVYVLVSTAAIILFVISGILFIPRNIKDDSSTLAEAAYDTMILISHPGLRENRIPERVNSYPPVQPALIPRTTDPEENTRSISNNPEIVKVPSAHLNSAVALFGSIDNLRPSPAISELPVTRQTEGNRISRFLAMHYRKIILSEEEPDDAPLKAYEIAEGSITGINKLLGWNMSITRTTGEDGEYKSVYFSSRLLKINSPVKNQSSE